MATSKLRAVIRHNDKEILLGDFNSKAQVNAALTAAEAIIRAIGGHKCPPQKLPNPERLKECIDLGLYDIEIEEIARLAGAREKFKKSLSIHKKFPSSPLMEKTFKGIPLNKRTSSQKLSDHI